MRKSRTVVDAELDRDSGARAPMAAPHFVAGLLAATIFIAGLAAISAYAEQRISHDIRAFAAARYPQKALGLAVQREALRHSDLLLLYGSSEVSYPNMSPFDGRWLFAHAPSGFSLFTVGGPGIPLLKIMENLGGLGASLKGKKVAISLAPTTFAVAPGALEPQYAGTFSQRQAMALVLSPDLTAGLKRRIARRIMTHPSSLERDTVLAATLRMVTDRSALRRPIYFAFLPLAHLHQALLETQDRILVLTWVIGRPANAGTRPPVPLPLDWPVLEHDAADAFRSRAGHNNPYGFADQWWQSDQRWIRAQRHSSNTQRFQRLMSESETWIDLEQLLQVLYELDARPLLLSMPFHAGFTEYTGVSPAATQQYYARVREIAARYGALTKIFDDHETDRDFFYDAWLHMSPKGWVFYDEALDAFYHDALR